MALGGGYGRAYSGAETWSQVSALPPARWVTGAAHPTLVSCF